MATCPCHHPIRTVQTSSPAQTCEFFMHHMPDEGMDEVVGG